MFVRRTIAERGWLKSSEESLLTRIPPTGALSGQPLNLIRPRNRFDSTFIFHQYQSTYREWCYDAEAGAELENFLGDTREKLAASIVDRLLTITRVDAPRRIIPGEEKLRKMIASRLTPRLKRGENRKNGAADVRSSNAEAECWSRARFQLKM